MIRAAAIVAGMMAFSGIGFAQCKIAVIDMQDAVIQSNEGKVKEAAFKVKADDWSAKLQKKSTDIDALTNKAKQQQSLASPAVIADLQKQIKDGQTELQRMSEDAQKDVDEYREQLLTPVMQAAEEVMTALSTEKGYGIVFDTSVPNSPIVYASKDCDITNEVKTRMNAKAAVAAPAAAAGAKPTTPPPLTAPKPAPPATAPKPATPAPATK